MKPPCPQSLPTFSVACSGTFFLFLLLMLYVALYYTMAILYALYILPFAVEVMFEYDNKTNIYSRTAWKAWKSVNSLSALWVAGCHPSLNTTEYFDSVNFKRAYWMEHGKRKRLFQHRYIVSCMSAYRLRVQHAMGCLVICLYSSQYFGIPSVVKRTFQQAVDVFESVHFLNIYISSEY